MEYMERQIVYIEWKGPFSLCEMKGFNAENDHGLYQIYGSHPVYGSSVLLFIGRTGTLSFGKTIYNEGWHHYDNAEGLQVYLGTLLSNEEISRAERGRLIEKSYKILVYAHSPAYNAEYINTFHNDRELHALQIINWKNYRDLLPEVSGTKWASGLGVALENFKLKKLFSEYEFDVTAWMPAKTAWGSTTA
jgi:hypothetical protein